MIKRVVRRGCCRHDVIKYGADKKKRINSQKKNQQQEQDSEDYCLRQNLSSHRVSKQRIWKAKKVPILVSSLKDAWLTDGLQDDEKRFLHATLLTWLTFNVIFTYAGYAIFGSGVGKNPAGVRSAGTEQNKDKKDMTRKFNSSPQSRVHDKPFQLLSSGER